MLAVGICSAIILHTNEDYSFYGCCLRVHTLYYSLCECHFCCCWMNKSWMLIRLQSIRFFSLTLRIGYDKILANKSHIQIITWWNSSFFSLLMATEMNRFIGDWLELQSKSNRKKKKGEFFLQILAIN